jgi:hypothetical protein
MKQENNSNRKKTSCTSESPAGSPNHPEQLKIQSEIKVKLIDEPPLTYFSSPCMLFELEANEDFRNL